MKSPAVIFICPGRVCWCFVSARSNLSAIAVAGWTSGIPTHLNWLWRFKWLLNVVTKGYNVNWLGRVVVLRIKLEARSWWYDISFPSALYPVRHSSNNNLPRPAPGSRTLVSLGSRPRWDDRSCRIRSSKGLTSNSKPSADQSRQNCLIVECALFRSNGLAIPFQASFESSSSPLDSPKVSRAKSKTASAISALLSIASSMSFKVSRSAIGGVFRRAWWELWRA